MQVYLVRHTETICHKGICYGQSEVELKSDYLVEFEKIKAQLPKEAVVYSSPLKRCKLLAEYLSSGQTINYDSRLQEMNFGTWEMQPWNAIPETELNPWMEDFVNVKVPSGESFTELYTRVVSFLNDCSLQDQSKATIIVAHAGVIRSILCHFTHLPLQDAFTNKVDFGAVITVQI
jgi:alpha-ribazole phosphatase